jgi:hypothetical protein
MLSATLRLTRKGSSRLIELRRGRFDISLDGRTIGSLNSQDIVEAPVEPGHHTLRVERGRYKSREQSFDVGDGDVVNFRCHGANLWFIWLASFAVPTLGISLRRE